VAQPSVVELETTERYGARQIEARSRGGVLRRNSSVFCAVVALAALIVAATTQTAFATHVRPKGATPFRVPLVPGFYPCTSPNSTHGEPLSFPSCGPPKQLSLHITVGTPDANGAAANMVGFMRLKVIPGDVRFTIAVSDVRCIPGTTSATVCNSPNSADGPDYSGLMEAVFATRVTDHDNGQSGTEAATLTDIPINPDVTCANTTSISEGGRCTLDTTADASIPGMVVDGNRTIWQFIDRVYLVDGGSDGNPHTGDGETTTFTQGLFVP
jgi:hypothetical protein